MSGGAERRRSPRFSQNEQVQLTLLGEDGRSASVRIVDSSANGMRIESVMRIKPGSLIRIECQDTLLLGEVLYCQPDESKFFLGVELTRALYGLAELRRLNDSLTGSNSETRDLADARSSS